MNEQDTSNSTINVYDLEQVKSRVGKPVPKVEPWCYEATRDNIRHYAHGIGDNNPLWCDPEYAKNSIYEGIVALPSFLFTTSRYLVGHNSGLPGLHVAWGGCDWNFHKWVKRNDEIVTETILTDVTVHDTKFAGPSVKQTYHTDFYNQYGDLVADNKTWCFRFNTDYARDYGTKYNEIKNREPKKYTTEELQKAFQHYRNEKIRGDDPLYWEDVQEGTELPTLVRGPSTITNTISYLQGFGGVYLKANRMNWKQLDKYPSMGAPNNFGIPDLLERSHYDDEFARQIGVPGAYDYGHDRAAWMMNQLTNWMSDYGFISSAKCKIHLHNTFGNILFITGKVKQKYIMDKTHLVEVEQVMYNQDNETSATGSGIIELPVRK